MATNMSVSITLSLVDRFTANIRTFQSQLQGLARSVQDFNRSMGGAGSTNSFARITNDVRALGSEVRNLVGQFNRLGRALTDSTTGGSFSQRQIADLRQVLTLQQQIIANSSRMVAGPPGAGRGAGPPGRAWNGSPGPQRLQPERLAD
jgi:hypothetical protein